MRTPHRTTTTIPSDVGEAPESSDNQEGVSVEAKIGSEADALANRAAQGHTDHGAPDEAVEIEKDSESSGMGLEEHNACGLSWPLRVLEARLSSPMYP